MQNLISKDYSTQTYNVPQESLKVIFEEAVLELVQMVGVVTASGKNKYVVTLDYKDEKDHAERLEVQMSGNNVFEAANTFITMLAQRKNIHLQSVEQ